MVQLLSVVMFSLLAVTSAQRSPFAGSRDPGVLPQYLPKGSDLNDRFGGDNNHGGRQPDYRLHAGTLQTEDMYNRAAGWPEDRKPFWYLNSAALQKDREQQQQQWRQQQQPQRQHQQQWQQQQKPQRQHQQQWRQQQQPHIQHQQQRRQHRHQNRQWPQQQHQH